MDQSIGKPYLIVPRIGGEEGVRAHPVQFVPGMYATPTIRPGSHNPNGEAGIWANDMEFAGSIEWSDDLSSGFASRMIRRPEDAIGVIGSIGGTRYRIDDILQTGTNVVVYQLTNLETCHYLAYGFGREHLDVRYAVEHYLKSIGAGRDADEEQLRLLSTRLLEAFPDDGPANFNCGVMLFAKGDFTAAHFLFEKSLQLDNHDVLSLLYDGAALAGMNEMGRAADRLIESESSASEQTEKYLKSFAPVRELLGRAVGEIVDMDPQRADVGQLWLKYFSPSRISD